ncbi:MAG TPA: zinc-dependent alcohol dehydrogenase family protein [Syntrophorhabdaceae bacterium]|nr:zinc-dependent alcohol dehydrogenase family protein [Syntrophorhabdaceae bacterium]HOL05636.1 zinc-dependent alcohol dehydrogenase family protein [Syntrophorhabdaceae bacterium]HPP41898.1 zinc-dependent alcohol dehydrogenase family protein [Syntrophorhabdaceae bacterium]
MKAMILDGIYNMNEVDNPLRPEDLPTPEPKEGEVLLRVSACGVCHTELDEIEGRTPPPDFPVILGHQVIGFVEKKGKNVNKLREGERVGVGWIYSSCGRCRFCKGGNENLCEDFKATGRDANGGYAEFMVVKEDFAFKIPDVFTDIEAAPLLCAGAIGYRSLRLTGIENGMNLGLIGFGASAHIVLQMARFKYPDSRIFVFARSEGERRFSLELGAYWAGDIEDMPPEKIHCAIDTTPVWLPVMEGLKKLEKGGRLVINAIRKETLDRDCLLNLDYPTHIWHEKEIKSVANVARNDIGEFLELSSQIPIKPEVQVYRLEDANMALSELKKRKIRGAKVLKIIE